MKKTNISALLLAALLLIQLLCAPVSAVTAEPAADAQADAQTASDNSAEDAAAEAEEAAPAIRLLGGTVERIAEYPIEDAVHRVVVIRKTAATPRQYPRQFAKIKKQPL